MKATNTAAYLQSIEETSVNELDNIYYPGYVQAMMDTNPERLQFEIEEFSRQFSSKK